MRDIPKGMLDEIVKRLAAELHPERIYLFGSHSQGTPHEHSDLDFLIVVPDDAGDTHDLAVRGRLAVRKIVAPMDLIVLHRTDMEKWASVRSTLPHTVSNEGRLLYAA